MPSSCAVSCCSELAGALGSKVSFPGDLAYNNTEASYWSKQEALLTPSCVIKPEASADVAEFMSIVTNITNCNFAIRTQGHAPAAGAANVQNGVTLDLTLLNTTNISGDHSVASVEAGSAWVDVYRTLNPFNKTVNGGRNGGVGVGGITLGGGISYYSSQVGWTCDTVVNFEVVLASSEIVNANATSNPDLFRALKGGGNNFGVVTRIDFKTVDIVELRGGHLFQSSDYVEPILTAVANIAAAKEYDVHTSIVTSCIFDSTSKEWTILSIPTYTLPEFNPPVYDELFSIPNITTESTASIVNISTLTAEPPIAQVYQTFLTSTYSASPKLLIDLFNTANETISSMQIPAGVTWSVTFEPLPTVFTKQGEGKNVLGTSEADGNGLVLLAGASWSDPSSTEFAQAMGPKIVKAMDDTAAKAGGLHRFKYLNYADPNQDVLGSYGEENLAFLRATSRKYDPQGVFQKKVPGGFKLGL
ncbi:FAD-binding domain-containing protein [Xylariaceae sp. FL1651]|nr:FAD-binding domain-containing protein [Xylariaceae sp. FL1651]